MKNGLVFILIAAMLSSFGMLDRNVSYVEPDQIEDLLNQRVEILNEYLYKNKNYEELELKLKKIETGEILKKDLESMSYIADNPTDLDLTKSVTVGKIDNMSNINGNIDINLQLCWIIGQYNQLDVETSLIKDYNLKCTKINNKLYLTQMTIIE